MDPIDLSPPPSADPPAISRLLRVDLERHLAQSPHRVWKALTRAKEVSAWMKFPAHINARPGGAWFVDFGPRGSIDAVVCTLEAPFVLGYVWGDSVVRWEIEREGDGVRLHFSHSGMKPELLAGLTAGWQSFLDQLETHLDGRPRPDRFRDLEQQYSRDFTPWQ